MAKKHMSKKGLERFKTRRLHKPKVDAKNKKGGPPLQQVQKGGVSKPQASSGKNKTKQRKRPDKGGAFGGGGVGLPHGYEPHQKILLVGEGNFSFARALVSTPGADGAGRARNSP